MDCSFAREHFMDYLEARLSPEEAADFLSHLDVCPACMRLFHEEREMAALFDTAEEPSLLETGFVEAVMARIDGPPVKEPVLPPLPSLPWRGVLAAALVLAALTLGLGFTLTHGFAPEESGFLGSVASEARTAADRAWMPLEKTIRDTAVSTAEIYRSLRAAADSSWKGNAWLPLCTVILGATVCVLMGMKYGKSFRKESLRA